MPKRKSNVAKAASIVKLVANRREGKSKSSEGLAAFVPELPFGEVFAGAGGYGVTRLSAKLGNLPIQKRWPRLAHHAPPALAAIGFFILMWLTGKLPKKYEKYITPILIGSGLAVIHEAVRTWTPGLGWLVGIDRPLLAPAVQAAAFQQQMPAPQPAVEYSDEPAPQGDDEGLSGDDEDTDLHTGIFAIK